MHAGLTRAERATLYHTMMEAITGKTEKGRKVAGWTEPEITLENFKMRRCYEMLVGDADVLLSPRPYTPPIFEAGGSLIPVGTTAFLKITGELIGAKMIEAYQRVSGVADMLAETIPERFKNLNYVGFNSLQDMEEVKEGQPFPQAGSSEKFVGSTDTRKYGQIVNLTKELIFHDQTGQVIMRSNEVGENLAYKKERTIIEAVQDVDPDGQGSLLFKPKGVAEALYRSSGTTNAPTVNLKTSNALTDFSNIDEAIQVFVAMVNETNQKLTIPAPLTLLVPESLMDKAALVTNPLTIHLNNDGGSTFGTQASTANGVHARRSITNVLSTVHLDGQSKTTWYLGNFQKQFKWREHWGLTVETGGQNLDSFFTNDVAFAVKGSWYGGPLIMDDKFVIQNTS